MRPRDSVGLPEGDSPSPEGVSRGRAAPIRSKLCVSRSDLRSLFPAADCLDKKRVKRRFQVPRRGGIAALSRGLQPPRRAPRPRKEASFALEQIDERTTGASHGLWKDRDPSGTRLRRGNCRIEFDELAFAAYSAQSRFRKLCHVRNCRAVQRNRRSNRYHGDCRGCGSHRRKIGLGCVNGSRQCNYKK